jgi:hypothetical protein
MHFSPSHAYYTFCLSHPYWFDHLNNIWWYLLCSLLHPPVMRCKVLTAMKNETVIFWVVASCSDVIGCQYFSRPCCLTVLGSDGILLHHYRAPQPRRLQSESSCYFLSCPNILLSTMFSNILSLCSSHILLNFMCSYIFTSVILMCYCHPYILEIWHNFLNIPHKWQP